MTAPSPERKPRCLRLVVNKHGKNECPNEQLPGSDLCAHHLAKAVEEYSAIVAKHTLGGDDEQ